MSNKYILLDDNWKLIDEYTTHKYFVCKDPSSIRYGQLLRELTIDECNIFDHGVIIKI